MKEKKDKIIFGILGGLVLACGCLVVITGFVYGRAYSKKYRVKMDISMDISTLTDALRASKMDAAVFPTTEQGLDALVHKPTVEPVPERWKATMKKVIEDPWGREYQYRQPGVHNPGDFDLWSLGPDGIESDDDIGNWDWE